MTLVSSLTDILESDVATSLERFGKTLDYEWIQEALAATGKATVRRRKLSSEEIVWLVIGMALFRDRSIQEVVSHLELVLPSSPKGDKKSVSVAPSAIPQGRYRVGPDPLKVIFARTAETWTRQAAEQNRWRDLALYGVDGTALRVPDTEENRDAFGLPPTSRGQSGYPQVRLVVLMALRSHLLHAASFGPFNGKKNGEQSLAKNLWKQVPDHSLVILDRGFMDYSMLYHLNCGDPEPELKPISRHWLIRGRKGLRIHTVKVLGTGDELVEIPINSKLQRKDSSLPQSMFVRAVHYQAKGFQPQFLLTTLTDPEKYPAHELVSLYHERWELELGYREIKTHLLEREESLRSKKTEGIHQEIWGILLAYNLVRREMLTVAQKAGVLPNRVSFKHSLMFIRVLFLVEAWACSPGNLPKRLDSFHEQLASLLILPERRTHRRYKRHVKIKMSGYARNPGRPQE
jgi:hypothetical protein